MIVCGIFVCPTFKVWEDLRCERFSDNDYDYWIDTIPCYESKHTIARVKSTKAELYDKSGPCIKFCCSITIQDQARVWFDGDNKLVIITQDANTRTTRVQKYNIDIYEYDFDLTLDWYFSISQRIPYIYTIGDKIVRVGIDNQIASIRFHNYDGTLFKSYELDLQTYTKRKYNIVDPSIFNRVFSYQGFLYIVSRKELLKIDKDCNISKVVFKSPKRLKTYPHIPKTFTYTFNQGHLILRYGDIYVHVSITDGVEMLGELMIENDPKKTVVWWDKDNLLEWNVDVVGVFCHQLKPIVYTQVWLAEVRRALDWMFYKQLDYKCDEHDDLKTYVMEAVTNK